ncbi:MAG: 4'-phosphopantetheinyl transferase superfamily protein [Firmicutes bacterium]|nr:4'-phosphopantetheinyl transferase superfamily protein [Bacillota bacterium]
MYQAAIITDPVDAELRENEMIRQVQQFLPVLAETDLDIQRTEKGKPFIVYADSGKAVSDVHVSVSHSGGYWACVVSDRVCGLDLQEMRPAAAERLADRFFTLQEGRYIKEAGLSGFYELWTRREALAKYTGLGFFGMSGKRPMLVNSEGRPAEHVIWDGKTVVFQKLQVPEGFMSVWCYEEAKEGER